MKRRILSILLLAALVIGLLPQGMLFVSAGGAEDSVVYPVEGGNLYFDEKTGTITSCNKTVTKADIPAEINGVPVTRIDTWAFSFCSALTTVTIPNSVTSIGRYAFYGCGSLANLTIPNSVTSIGDHAFFETAFYNAAERWTDGVLYLDDWLIKAEETVSGNYAIRPEITKIADGAFSQCSSLTGVTIPNGVINIGSYTFKGCGALTSVTLPSGVTSIGDYAFSGCGSLASFTIPDSVTSIGEHAFSDTAIYNAAERWKDGVLYLDNWLIDAQQTITGDCVIPMGTTGIADNAFDFCYDLTSVTIPDSVTSIGDYAFSGCGNLTRATLGNGVTSIGFGAFAGCSSLTDVTLPDSLTVIGNYAFNVCTGLTSVAIPNSVTVIGVATFNECTGLTSVTIPDSVTVIGDFAFSECTGLTSITIPESVTVIDTNAFLRCSSLQSVYFMGDAPALGKSVFSIFDEETLTEVNIPGLMLYYIDGKAGWTSPIWNGYPTAAWVHAHSYADTVTVPTCTEQGYTTHTCECGDSYTDTYVEALGHDFGAWAQTKAPNCTEKGEEKRTCSRCDAFETRTVEPTGHTEVIDPAVPATCTEKGKTEGKHCAVCGTVLVAQEVIPALGHQYENGVCSVCGEKSAALVFSDIPANEWYVDAVDYAVENGLMNGVGGGKFEPEGSMTRAMLVTVLWRYAGEPMEGENTFTDVPSGTWYTESVVWAAANGIVGGVGNGKFDPEGNVTREQMAVILFRYAQKKGVDTSKRGDLSAFPDKGDISSWAKDAVQWAVAEKIINGSDGKLLPLGNATRAQVSAILMRFIENIMKA